MADTLDVERLRALLEWKRTAGIPGTPRETFLYVARDNLRDWLEENADALLDAAEERAELNETIAEQDRAAREWFAQTKTLVRERDEARAQIDRLQEELAQEKYFRERDDEQVVQLRAQLDAVERALVKIKEHRRNDVDYAMEHRTALMLAETLLRQALAPKAPTTTPTSTGAPTTTPTEEPRD